MNLSKTIPPRPARVLERERLVNRLREWEDKKLVIIHAQAGQGKSTLAAGYAASLPGPSVWYNMDRDDDNPALFLATFAEALRRVCPECPAIAPVVPQNRYGFGGVRQSIGNWIGQAFAGLSRPLLVVFDDYNNTSSPTVLREILKLLIETTPPAVRFVLICRTQPELEIARLRAKQAVGEVTGMDLRFTDQETQQLFTTVFGMPVADSEAEVINRTAEGWPAGLVLMHEFLAGVAPQIRSASLSGRPDGFRMHVFDYLAQEVFSHLPAGTQSFLLRTSILDEITQPLIQILTDLSGAQAAKMVKDLRQRNLFITSIDHQATVFRYHALFRDFLRRTLLSRTSPQEVKKLYTRVIGHFLKRGQPVRAVDLYLDSGQFDKAVTLIESMGRELIAGGRTQTILQWIQSLPLEYAERPWLLLYKAISFRFTDPRTALSFYELALTGFRADRKAYQGTEGQMLSLAGIIEACFYAGGNFKRMERAAATATALLRRRTRESANIRARLLLAVGTAYFFIGRLRPGADALSRALELFRKRKDHFYQIHSAIYLAPCSIYLGEFLQAREAIQKGYEALHAIPDEAGGEAALSMARAMTALFEGKFDEAQEAIDKCHSLAYEHDLEAFDFLSLDIGGWLKMARGDYRSADMLLNECKRKADELRNAFFSTSAAHLLAINHLHQNNTARALAEEEYAYSVRVRYGSNLFSAVALAGLGAIRLKQDKLAQAERDLNKAMKEFQRIGAAQQLANVHLLLAMLAMRKKKADQARKHIASGFRIGKERDFTYYYLLTPAELAGLAGIGTELESCSGYCSALLHGPTAEQSAPVIRIYCLGGFQVFRGDTLIGDNEWKSRRAKSLIKLLAAHDGQKLPREVAMDMLWSEEQPANHARTLNSLLHRLRKVLEQHDDKTGDGVLIIQDDEGLALNEKKIWTDVGQFLRTLEDAGSMKKGRDAAQALALYEKAVALYRGDFLPGDLYDQWAGQVRDRLKELYCTVLNDAAELARSAGMRDKVADFDDKLFRTDSCNELACRRLMQSRVAEGRRNEAIRIFERCRLALHAELDIEPGPETLELYRSIIGG